MKRKKEGRPCLAARASMPDRRLFAAAVRLVLHAHGPKIADTITAAFRRLVRRTGHLTGLLDAHSARDDFAGVGASRDQGRFGHDDRRRAAGAYEVLRFLDFRLFGKCDRTIRNTRTPECCAQYCEYKHPEVFHGGLF